MFCWNGISRPLQIKDMLTTEITRVLWDDIYIYIYIYTYIAPAFSARSEFPVSAHMCRTQPYTHTWTLFEVTLHVASTQPKKGKHTLAVLLETCAYFVCYVRTFSALSYYRAKVPEGTSFSYKSFLSCSKLDVLMHFILMHLHTYAWIYVCMDK